jgi:pimeloyl-ACP methyl ester carboxylesterase
VAKADPATAKSAVPVISSDDVEVAVHDLGGVGPQLLISHATGFHGRCYLPLADALRDRFHCIAFDYRGHGDTAAPLGHPVEWARYGDDAAAMARSLDTPVMAFGHSMGGASLLMAAHRDPTLFSRLVLFEPIVYPAQGLREDNTPSPMIAAARRRRVTFPSYDEAIANFARKPPLGSFTPAALDAYVRYGFREDAHGHVHIKCRPEAEASTFEMSTSHHTRDVLHEITIPVLVLAGVIQPMQPASIAAGVAEQLGNGTYLQLDELDHFGPMTHPNEVADLIAEFLRPS